MFILKKFGCKDLLPNLCKVETGAGFSAGEKSAMRDMGIFLAYL